MNSLYRHGVKGVINQRQINVEPVVRPSEEEVYEFLQGEMYEILNQSDMLNNHTGPIMSNVAPKLDKQTLEEP